MLFGIKFDLKMNAFKFSCSTSTGMSMEINIFVSIES